MIARATTMQSYIQGRSARRGRHLVPVADRLEVLGMSIVNAEDVQRQDEEDALETANFIAQFEKPVNPVAPAAVSDEGIAFVSKLRTIREDQAVQMVHDQATGTGYYANAAAPAPAPIAKPNMWTRLWAVYCWLIGTVALPVEKQLNQPYVRKNMGRGAKAARFVILWTPRAIGAVLLMGIGFADFTIGFFAMALAGVVFGAGHVLHRVYKSISR